MWNDKRLNIKWSVLQLRKADGGLASPNFKLYHWAFMLRGISFWMDDDKESSWKNTEKELMPPTRLKDFILLGISARKL